MPFPMLFTFVLAIETPAGREKNVRSEQIQSYDACWLPLRAFNSESNYVLDLINNLL